MLELNLIFTAWLSLLFCSAFFSFRLLSNYAKTFTLIGFLLISWYLYLFILYGPTSGFYLLIKTFNLDLLSQKHLSKMDLFIDLSYLRYAIVFSIPALILPLITLKVLLIKRIFNTRFVRDILFYDLRPLLKSKYLFLFGIIGTVVQFYISLRFGSLWATPDLIFVDLDLVNKSLFSQFIIFSFTPQLALFFYFSFTQRLKNWRHLSISILCLSIAIAIFSFVLFGQRTYALIEVLLLFLLIYKIDKKLLLFAAFLIPILAFAVYTFATIKRNPLPDTINALSIYKYLASSKYHRIFFDLSYRTGFGNDTIVLSLANCFKEKADISSLGITKLLTSETIIGLPEFIRAQLLYDGAQAWGELTARCNHTIDMFDTKSQYFLLSGSFLLSSLIYPLFWLCFHSVILLIPTTLFEFGIAAPAFMVPAAFHAFLFGTSPSDLISFLKISFPMVIILFILRFSLNAFRATLSRE